MIRTVLLFALTFAALALAACGGGDNAQTTAPTAVQATTPTSTSATASAHASATPTAARTTPAASATTVQGSTGGLTLGDPINSEVPMGVNCTVVADAYRVVLTGVLNGNFVGLTLGGHKTGTLDYSDTTSSMNILMSYGSSGTAVAYTWIGLSGSAGAAGTVTVAADHSGSMDISIPPFSGSGGSATADISAKGAWTCGRSTSQP